MTDVSSRLEVVARSFAERPRSHIVSDRAPGNPRDKLGKRLGDTPGDRIHGNAYGQSASRAAQNRVDWRARIAGTPTRTWGDVLSQAPLTAVIIMLVVVVSFQQFSRAIDRRDGAHPVMTRLLFAPGLRL